ncbi:MAG: sigma-54 dependent transcriptional regulator, partial [Pseudomonadota bacterium]
PLKMNSYRIYLVDDEESVRIGLTFGLKHLYGIEAFSSAETAISAIEKNRPDLVLLDIGLPGMSGIQALKKIKKIDPNIVVIMITAFEGVDTVVSAMKLGAIDYIIKPIHLDFIKNTIHNALETTRLRKEVLSLQEKCIREDMPVFVGESRTILDVMQFIEKIAKSPDAPVLIAGESGTGKELVARTIHYKSPLFKGPFVALNCAAIPHNLIESELFGYEKGAFSGAGGSGKPGLIQQASGGSLFLDEVGDLSPEAQAKLLRFLESGEYYRLGSAKMHRVKTRALSATNKNLEEMIETGRFRKDLYHRLAVIRLTLPTLNERRDDILPLAKFFLLEFSKKYAKNFSNISPELESVLLRFHWQGNIRELKNLIERGVLVGEGPVLNREHIGITETQRKGPVPASQTEDLSPFAPLPEKGIDLTALEAHYLREAYHRAEGNDRTAAKLLQMSYYAFRYKKKKLKDLPA